MNTAFRRLGVIAACLTMSPFAALSPAAAVGTDCNGHLDTNDAFSPTVALVRDEDPTAFLVMRGFLPCRADNADYWTINWLKGVEGTIDVRMKSPKNDNYNLALFQEDGTRVGSRTPAGPGGSERIVFNQPVAFDSNIYVGVTPRGACDWSSTSPYVLRYNTNPS